jgi:hypothetical protein
LRKHCYMPATSTLSTPASLIMAARLQHGISEREKEEERGRERERKRASERERARESERERERVRE